MIDVPYKLLLAARGYLRWKRFNRKPPIFIGGCARSGTTLLSAMLSAHPNIYMIPVETKAFCVKHYKLKPTIYQRLRIPRWLGDAKVKHSAHRWAEKTPKNIHEIQRIKNRFGSEVRFIQMIRDGRDSVLSKHPDTGSKRQYHVSPERWIEDVSVGVKYLSDPSVLTVRYEELITHYETVMRSVLEYIDEPWVPQMQTWWEHTQLRDSNAWYSGVRKHSTDSIGKHKDPTNQERVAELMRHDEAKQLLEQLGYVD